MKTRTARKTNHLFFFVGPVLILASLLFSRTGSYPVVWSSRRIFLLVLGLITTFSTIGYWYFENNLAVAVEKLEHYIAQHPISHWWKKKQFIDSDKNQKSTYIYRTVFLWSLAIFATYLWFISAGQWINLPHTTGYYDQLANAFSTGHVYLGATPNPQEEIPKFIDFSLYKGKYYLYFGPAPATPLAILKIFSNNETGDHYLVFAFVVGLYIFQCLLIVHIWERFFWELPVWTALLGILVLAFFNPLIYTLVTARVYEAANSAGQFFFMGGLYFICITIDRYPFSLKKLTLAGLFISFAVASRITLVPAVGVIILLVIYWITKSLCTQNRRWLLISIIVFLSPLVLGAICLCLYNYIRFDSIFETGFGYTSAGIIFRKHNIPPFSLVYFPQNLYNYFFNPPRILDGFPFFSADRVNQTFVIPFIKLPPAYTGEKITGMLYSAPFTIFALLPAFLLFKQINDRRIMFFKNIDFLSWLNVSLLGFTVFAFTPLLLFFWVTMRYMLDFMPSLILLGVIGFWQGYSLLSTNIQHILYSIMALSLAIFAVLMSFFLAFSINLWWIDYFYKR